MNKKTYTILAAVVIMSTVFGGCFAWNYVEEGYDNFSAYFNTFYNASVAFDDGMQDVKLSKKSYELSLIAGDHPAPFAISQKAKEDFNTVIVEASKVLQYHPHSEFTEDCLFMIGIAYYYQDDDLRGERKFLEIESTFPNTKRFAEAEMYYGGLQLNGLQNETGLDRVLNAIRIGKENKNRKIVAMSSDILSDYYLKQGDTLTAAAYLDTASTFSSGDDAAIYSCRSGELLTGAGEYTQATKEFSQALKEAHDVNIRFYSAYYFARAQRLLGRYYIALKSLKPFRDDDKYFDFFPLIDYQKAVVLYDSGEVSTAVTAFQKIDTAYATSVAATRSAYRLGNIYLRLVGDFQTALKFYQRVGSHPAVYSVSDKGRELATTLQNYLMLSYKSQLSDSLYRHASAAVERKDTTVKYQQSDLDSLYEHAADSRDELAGLFMFRLQMPDSAVRAYKIVLSDFPGSKVYPSVLYSLGEYYYSSGDTSDGKMYLDELVNKDPESQYAVSACSVLGIEPPALEGISHARYSEAITLVDSGHYREAVDSLKGLVADKKSSLAPQALYTVGWVYENKLDEPDSAYDYYKRLSTEFPTSNFTSHVTMAVTGFETAQRDSALAKRMREDSVAAANARAIKADSAAHAPEKLHQPAHGVQEKPGQAVDTSRSPMKMPEDTLRTGKGPPEEPIERRK